jgi:hypothetical protein
MLTAPLLAVRAGFVALDIVFVGLLLLVAWRIAPLARHAVRCWRETPDNGLTATFALGIFGLALGVALGRTYGTAYETSLLFSGLAISKSWWQLWQVLRLCALWGAWLILWALYPPGHCLPRLVALLMGPLWVALTIAVWQFSQELQFGWNVYP